VFFTKCGTSKAQVQGNGGDSIRFNTQFPDLRPRSEVMEAYRGAIAEYIKAVYKDGKPLPDTLFIGENLSFPEIRLPLSIEGANVAMINGDSCWNRLMKRNSLAFLNVIGWITKDKMEFRIVTFADGGKPQQNCSEYFTHSADRNELHLDSLKFDYPYGK
jgi:hypothetical protein